jgi:hypothetical protein
MEKQIKIFQSLNKIINFSYDLQSRCLLIYATFVYAVIALNRIFRPQIFKTKLNISFISIHNIVGYSQVAVNVKNTTIATPPSKAQK